MNLGAHEADADVNEYVSFDDTPCLGHLKSLHPFNSSDELVSRFQLQTLFSISADVAFEM